MKKQTAEMQERKDREEGRASWLKVEIVPWVERVKFPGGYETKLAKVNLLVFGKLEVDGAAEIVVPFTGPYQVRWHFGHSSAFKPTPEAKREAEIAIVEAFVRHVDAMRARFANPAWWGIEE